MASIVPADQVFRQLATAAGLAPNGELEDRAVGIEVDGPMHFAPFNAARDALRDAELRSLGWVILRVDDQSHDLLDQVSLALCLLGRVLP